jgi:hypothetical protein
MNRFAAIASIFASLAIASPAFPLESRENPSPFKTCRLLFLSHNFKGVEFSFTDGGRWFGVENPSSLNSIHTLTMRGIRPGGWKSDLGLIQFKIPDSEGGWELQIDNFWVYSDYREMGTQETLLRKLFEVAEKVGRPIRSFYAYNLAFTNQAIFYERFVHLLQEKFPRETRISKRIPQPLTSTKDELVRKSAGEWDVYYRTCCWNVVREQKEKIDPLVIEAIEQLPIYKTMKKLGLSQIKLERRPNSSIWEIPPNFQLSRP